MCIRDRNSLLCYYSGNYDLWTFFRVASISLLFWLFLTLHIMDENCDSTSKISPRYSYGEARSARASVWRSLGLHSRSRGRLPDRQVNVVLRLVRLLWGTKIEKVKNCSRRRSLSMTHQTFPSENCTSSSEVQPCGFSSHQIQLVHYCHRQTEARIQL